MRSPEDIQAEIDALESLRKTLNAESESIEKYAMAGIWMQARFNLKTEKEKQLFDLWMKAVANSAYITALQWTLNERNPRMFGETEPKDHIPADVMHKINFYHGMHTHIVCKLKGNLFHYHRDGNQKAIEDTMMQLRKYIPGI